MNHNIIWYDSFISIIYNNTNPYSVSEHASYFCFYHHNLLLHYKLYLGSWHACLWYLYSTPQQCLTDSHKSAAKPIQLYQMVSRDVLKDFMRQPNHSTQLLYEISDTVHAAVSSCTSVRKVIFHWSKWTEMKCAPSPKLWESQYTSSFCRVAMTCSLTSLCEPYNEYREFYNL